MSEVQPRNGGTRGRGGFRGGRGGYRGARTNKSHFSSDQPDTMPSALEEEGEVGELKRQFGDKLPGLREVCPGWSDEDLVFALQETDGDVDAAFERISSGAVSQWEVKKKPPKVKESTAGTEATSGTRGRGRGNLEARGRGRGAERGRGRGGRAGSQVNGTKATEKTSKPAEDGWGDAATALTSTMPGAWDPTPANGDTAAAGDWANESGKDALDSLETEEAKPAAAAAPSVKASGWAGLFAKPTAAPAPVKKAAPPATTAAPEELQPEVPTINDNVASEETLQPPPIEPIPMDDTSTELPSAAHSETAHDLPPSKDELTESNLDQLPDTSHPPTSATAASTVASTQDPLSGINHVSAAQIRPGMSGHAASALKAMSGVGRSASYSRKIMEQQEAVVMPGHAAVDRAAVQFGKLGMGDGSDDVDVDDEREEPETRTQLPDDSPAAPRASLPPSMPESRTSDTPANSMPPASATSMDSTQGLRQAPGLPPAPQHSQSSLPGSSLQDQYRYGQTQKPYDPFGQQPQSQSQPQEPFSHQISSQTQPTSGAGPDYAAYYGANARDAYQQYYAQYAQSQGQDTQRGGSSYGASSQEPQGQYANSRHGQNYGQENAESGHNTPAPTMPTHQSQHSQHTQPSQHLPQNQNAYSAYNNYGYGNTYGQQYPQYGAGYMGGPTQHQAHAQPGHRYGPNRPAFDDARRQEQEQNNYYQQYGYGHNQQYGGSYKSSMYAQPQQYSQEYASANPGGREGMYARSGSAQAPETQSSAGSNPYAGMPDPFGRTPSAYGHAQTMSSQHSGHQGDDAIKAAGPSPSMQGGRPTSTVNSAQGQSGFAAPQSQQSAQQAFGGFSQYGGAGGFGGHQSSHPQGAAYNSYGSSNAAFASYPGYGGGRGWNGGNYGANH